MFFSIYIYSKRFIVLLKILKIIFEKDVRGRPKILNTIETNFKSHMEHKR
jgi:hypothetical protein